MKSSKQGQGGGAGFGERRGDPTRGYYFSIGRGVIGRKKATSEDRIRGEGFKKKEPWTCAAAGS
jgi:hypothetical protein